MVCGICSDHLYSWIFYWIHLESIQLSLNLNKIHLRISKKRFNNYLQHLKPRSLGSIGFLQAPLQQASSRTWGPGGPPAKTPGAGPQSQLEGPNCFFSNGILWLPKIEDVQGYMNATWFDWRHCLGDVVGRTASRTPRCSASGACHSQLLVSLEQSQGLLSLCTVPGCWKVLYPHIYQV